ncbi:hypothetical protein H671_5g13940 [Cricetulus griseus]|uniref:Uncharacterized protein n=1 Tax=Cricetulus griseus TaxID=10029 RepID=A0A061I3B0_CRIGR|nr:hypothetical protein H671_5g13940 [Cricetulus griseus]
MAGYLLPRTLTRKMPGSYKDENERFWMVVGLEFIFRATTDNTISDREHLVLNLEYAYDPANGCGCFSEHP